MWVTGQSGLFNPRPSTEAWVGVGVVGLRGRGRDVCPFLSESVKMGDNPKASTPLSRCSGEHGGEYLTARV